EAFETLIERDRPATVTELAALGKVGGSKPTAPPGFADATRVIGKLRDLHDFCATHDPVVVAEGVYGYEVAALRTYLARLDAWVAVFAAHLNEDAPRIGS